MKCSLLTMLIYIISIKDQENYEFYKYTNVHNDTPVFDLVELMKQPKLLGIRDENWPYAENEDPFSQYHRNGCKICQCGMKRNKRIVNGLIARPNEFPWQVLITRNNRFYCGGSLINDLFVLTAAHCVLGYKITELRLRFGVYNRYISRGIYRDINGIWIAKGFNAKTFSNDAAIIRLKTKLKITQNISPICLPILGSNYAGQLATVTGWGQISINGPVSDILRKTKVSVLTNEECRKTGYGNTILASQLCAGANGRDACLGDSGNPLIIAQKGRQRQIGIVSFGNSCNLPNFPGGYTRVTKLRNDIVRIASRDGACWCSDNNAQ